MGKESSILSPEVNHARGGAANRDVRVLEGKNILGSIPNEVHNSVKTYGEESRAFLKLRIWIRTMDR